MRTLLPVIGTLAMQTAQFTQMATPLGPLVIAASGTGLIGSWFEGEKYFPNICGWQESDSNELLTRARDQLNHYFNKGPVKFDVPLDVSVGTLFQQQVTFH